MGSLCEFKKKIISILYLWGKINYASENEKTLRYTMEITGYKS